MPARARTPTAPAAAPTDPADPRVKRLLAAGWHQVDAFGSQGWWQSPDKRFTTQEISAALRQLETDQQAAAAPRE